MTHGGSFDLQEITTLPRPELPRDVKERLMRPAKIAGKGSAWLSEATPNPSIEEGQYNSWNGVQQQAGNGNG